MRFFHSAEETQQVAALSPRECMLHHRDQGVSCL